MAYTGRELFERAMAVMDEISETGVLNPDDVAEYEAKAPLLLDIWSRRMAKVAGKKKTFELSCVRKKNLLGDLNHVSKIIENNGEKQDYSGKGANCFYLEVDGDCIVTFKENGNSISGKYAFNNGEETEFTDTINITVPEGTTTFLPLKGILFPGSQKSTITMTISGNYYFRHINRALSPYKYSSALKVPNFETYYKVEMPEDFISRSQIITETPKLQYQEGNPSIKWENDRDLYVMFSFEGIIRINYVSLPAKITSLEQEIEYPENVAMSAVPYLVKHFARADMNDEIARDAKEEFMQMYADTTIREPLTPTEIVDVFF
jgi:hypothetical protein